MLALFILEPFQVLKANRFFVFFGGGRGAHSWLLDHSMEFSLPVIVLTGQHQTSDSFVGSAWFPSLPLSVLVVANPLTTSVQQPQVGNHLYR